MAEPVINGQEYSFADIQINLFGRLIEGLEGISYQVTRAHGNVKGRGARNVAMSRGTKDFEGSITLIQSEVEAIQRGLKPGQDLTDIPPFPIVVSYAPDTGPITTDILEGCRFNQYRKQLSSSDENMPIELSLSIFNIKYNA